MNSFLAHIITLATVDLPSAPLGLLPVVCFGGIGLVLLVLLRSALPACLRSVPLEHLWSLSVLRFSAFPMGWGFLIGPGSLIICTGSTGFRLHGLSRSVDRLVVALA
jgi:hypothetical protein